MRDQNKDKEKDKDKHNDVRKCSIKIAEKFKKKGYNTGRKGTEKRIRIGKRTAEEKKNGEVETS